MRKEEAWRIVELLKDVDWFMPVNLNSNLGRIRVAQLLLIEKAYAVLVDELV